MLKLHIGGKMVHHEWKIVDIEARPEVDYVSNASDLSHFQDNTVDVIYASHVLEHFYYNIENELVETPAILSMRMILISLQFCSIRNPYSVVDL
jgi:predicted SAM-dependent methyltransferase